MKNICSLFKILFFFLVIGLLGYRLSAQDNMSKASWLADLRFLQKTVHQDYPFLFKKTTAGAFDKKVDELAASIPKMQDNEIIAGLARIVSSFEYGHTSIDFSGGEIKYHRLPLNLYHFSDGIFIEGIHKDYEQALGAEVLKVEGVPIDDALLAIRPIVPVENDQYFKGYGLGYLTIPEFLHAQGVTKELKNEIILTLKKNGETFEETISASAMQKIPQIYGFIKGAGDWLSVRDQSETPYYLKNLDKIYYFDYLPESKTVYVRYSQIEPDPSESISDFYDRVFDFIENNEVEKLVIDVRLNGGGNNFYNKTVVTKIIRSDKINQPGKFFVIIGRRTFSACQNLINEFDNYTNVIFVGEPSAENVNFYGDNRVVRLPNSNIPVRLSWAWWQDKPQWQNEDWTAPQLAVNMSFEEYRTNQDPILEKALNFESDNFILDPMEHLTNLFLEGKLELVKNEAKRMVGDATYGFFDFESELNKVGYMLMHNNQMKEGLFIFQMNVDLFPESAYSYIGLAEAHWKFKDTAKATVFFNKALKLDPEGEAGDKARNMLKQIDGQ